MANLLGSLLRQATRKEGEPLNILTAPTHEANDSSLCRTQNKFYGIRQIPAIKDWLLKYRPLPTNYFLLNPSLGPDQILPDVELDLILSQHRFGQAQLFSQVSRSLHVNMIQYEHTLPHPSWPPQHLEQLKRLRGHLNVFISEFSRAQWGWKPEEAIVVYHGIDTEKFCSDPNIEKKQHILAVCNDWVNRDWCCGYNLWKEISKDLPVFPVGDSPGYSLPAPSLEKLVEYYQEAQVFCNTSLISPIPTALLEAAACSTCIVTTGTAMIPEIIKHGYNGLMSNNPSELRKYLVDALNDKAMCAELGANARKTVLEKFSLDTAIERWHDVFNNLADKPYEPLT